MIKNFFITLWNFSVAIVFCKFSLRKHNAKLYYCGLELYKTSLRYPAISNTSYKITLTIYKDIILRCIKKKNQVIQYNQNTANAVFDSGASSSDLRIEYVENLSKEKIQYYIAKDTLLAYQNFIQFSIIFFFLFLSFPFTLFLSLVSKNKLHSPLIVLQLVECFHLLNIVKKNRIKKVHYFSIFEGDSNIVAHILMKESVFVNKIPSEVPLVFHNKTVIANQLSVCFAYQLDEYDKYRDTMFVDLIESWAPESFFKNDKRFLFKERELNTMYDIGFFSSGNWLRKKLGHADLEDKLYLREEDILKNLIAYCEIHHLKLCIFLHPLEKKLAHRYLSMEYYDSFLAKSHVYLFDIDTPSIEGFDRINLGIALYSTLMYERLFLGFKTLIIPSAWRKSFIEESSFFNIIVDEKDISFKIEKNLPLSEEAFFNLNNLKNYRFFENKNLLSFCKWK